MFAFPFYKTRVIAMAVSARFKPTATWRLVGFLIFFPLSVAIGQEPGARVSENSLGMRLVRIEPGEFEMGMTDQNLVKFKHPFSAYQREIHDYVESPAFPVRLSRAFDLGASEVTVAQFRHFITASGYQTDAERAGKAWIFHPDSKDALERFALTDGANWHSPGFEQTDAHPVVCVSFRDAVAFCKWLSEKEKAVYRLPTEAEWEYACRAGTTTIYYTGDDPDGLYAAGNVADAALYAIAPDDVERQRATGLQGPGDGVVYTAAVSSYKPNGWGLYDMHGNVWEWCSDKYSDRWHQQMIDLAREKGSRTNPEPIVDPQGPDTTPQHEHGDWRSLRGGSWYVAPLQCRCSVRAFAEARDAFSYIGFRVVRER